jgi:hypothetical protein
VSANVLLADGKGGARAEGHTWLAPWDEDERACLEVVLHEPRPVSVVRVRNYSKTPARGGCEYELYADDLVVSRGSLRPAPAPAVGAWQSILFADDDETLALRGHEVHRGDAMPACAVLLVDAGRVLEGHAVMQAENARSGAAGGAGRGSRQPALHRPTTAVTPR